MTARDRVSRDVRMSNATTGVYVALLRAVNVGGRNALSSIALKAAAERAGFDDVRTYLQSGNVVFTAAAEPAPQIAHHLQVALFEEVALEVAVVVRTDGELDALLAARPFGSSETEVGKHGLVAFYDRPLDDSTKERLQSYRAPGEALSFATAEAFAYLPAGSGRSKLGNALHKYAPGVVTVRNWNTVCALARLAQELHGR